DPPAARAEYLVAFGLLADQRDDFAVSEQAMRSALELFDQAGMGEEPAALEAMRGLANQLADLGQRGAAAELYRRAGEITRARWGDAHPNIGALEYNMGLLARDVDDLRGAADHFERATAIIEPVYGRDSEIVGRMYVANADVLQKLGQIEAARP